MIYLHIGFPKAASTTIQRFLTTNSAFLAEQNLVYPRMYESRKAAAGETLIEHNVLAAELRRGGPGVTWNRLEQFLENRARGRDVVLSAESMSSCDPALVRQALGNRDATIICYVREFWKAIVSHYSQQTRNGANTADFDTFLDNNLNVLIFRLADLFAKWSETFGANNIKIRLLDERTLLGGDIRRDMLDAIGVAGAQMDFRKLTATEDANTSPGWKTLEIVRDLNTSLFRNYFANRRAQSKAELHKRGQKIESPVRAYAAFIGAKAAVIGASLGVTERGQYLTAEQFQRCCDAFDTEVDALNALKLGSSLPHAWREGFVARPFLPGIEHVPAPEVMEFFRRLLPLAWWHLLAEQLDEPETAAISGVAAPQRGALAG